MPLQTFKASNYSPKCFEPLLLSLHFVIESRTSFYGNRKKDFFGALKMAFVILINTKNQLRSRLDFRQFMLVIFNFLYNIFLTMLHFIQS